MGVLSVVNNQNFQLYRASSEDAEALAEFGRREFARNFAYLYRSENLEAYLAGAYDLQRIEEELLSEESVYYMAGRESAVLGFAKACRCKLPVPQPRNGDYEIQRLYICEQSQGAGVGGQLMEAALNWCESRQAEDIYIGVWENNFRAQRFYARFGFAPVGEYRFIVGDQFDREIILHRKQNAAITPPLLLSIEEQVDEP